MTDKPQETDLWREVRRVQAELTGYCRRTVEAEIALDLHRAALAHVVYLSQGRFPGIRPALEAILEMRGLSFEDLAEMGPEHRIDPEIMK